MLAVERLGVPEIYRLLAVDRDTRDRHQRDRSPSAADRPRRDPVCNDVYGYNGWAGFDSIKCVWCPLAGPAKMNGIYLAAAAAGRCQGLMCLTRATCPRRSVSPGPECRAWVTKPY